MLVQVLLSTDTSLRSALLMLPRLVTWLVPHIPGLVLAHESSGYRISNSASRGFDCIVPYLVRYSFPVAGGAGVVSPPWSARLLSLAGCWWAYSIFSVGLLCIQSTDSMISFSTDSITLAISPAPGYDSHALVNTKIAAIPRFYPAISGLRKSSSLQD